MRFVYVWQRLFPFLEVLGNVFKTFQAWFCSLNTVQCFILTAKSQILPSDMYANTPTLIRRIVCKFPKCRRFLIWYVFCFLRRSQFWAQNLFTQIHKNFVFFQRGLRISCSHPTGNTNIFHKKTQWLQKNCPQSTGCIRTVKIGNLILWFMRNHEEVGRAACQNRIRH